MDLRGRRSINKAAFMWAVAALLLLIMATPALSTIFAAPGSVNTKALVNKAVKTKKIANGAVTAAKINRTGLNADLLDGRDGSGYVAKTGDQTMAGKLTAPSFGYSAPKTSYLSINASAFNPGDSSYGHSGLNSGFLFASGPGLQFFVAPVQLPHGATVKSVRFRAWDNDGVRDYSAQMARLTAPAAPVGTYESMAQKDTVGLASSTSWRLLEDTSISFAQIDNQNYDYQIIVSLYGDANVGAGQVMITYETSGP